MNTKAIAAALRQLADAIESPGAGGSAPRPPAPAFTEDDLPPLPPLEQYEPVRERVHAAAARAESAEDTLGRCPVHNVPWTVKPSGVSKAGKPYRAFWKCAERDGDTYCDQKPVKVWQDSHPPRESAAA